MPPREKLPGFTFSIPLRALTRDQYRLLNTPYQTNGLSILKMRVWMAVTAIDAISTRERTHDRGQGPAWPATARKDRNTETYSDHARGEHASTPHLPLSYHPTPSVPLTAHHTFSGMQRQRYSRVPVKRRRGETLDSVFDSRYAHPCSRLRGRAPEHPPLPPPADGETSAHAREIVTSTRWRTPPQFVRKQQNQTAGLADNLTGPRGQRPGIEGFS